VVAEVAAAAEVVVEEEEEEGVVGLGIGEADGAAEVLMPVTTAIPGMPMLAKAVEHRQLLLPVDETGRSDGARRHDSISF
jgi:hypothetical protein